MAQDENKIDDVTKMLIEIKADVSSIKAQLDDVHGAKDVANEADNKADKALAMSIENTHTISAVKHWVYALISVLAVSGITPLLIYIIEKFL